MHKHNKYFRNKKLITSNLKMLKSTSHKTNGPSHFWTDLSTRDDVLNNKPKTIIDPTTTNENTQFDKKFTSNLL